MELCGAHMMAKLTNHLVTVFQNKIQIRSVHLWTDSEIVLAWLKSHPSRWSVFVANCVSDIQSRTSSYSWHHVRTDANPADLLSRGCMPENLTEFWWQGPVFLRKVDSNFESNNKNKEIINPPEKRKSSHLSHRERNSELEFLSSLERFSVFRRLQGTIAYCYRFLYNAKNPSAKKTGILSVEELSNSELKIVKLIQKQAFSTEIRKLPLNKDQQIECKTLKILSPFLDDRFMLRVGGRLSRAVIPYEHKHPLLLPAKSPLVRLLIKREHLRLCHAAPQNTLANFRLRYWPIDGMREVKSVIHQCLICFRFKAKPMTQLMGDLPKERFSITRPFMHTGVDFAGPFHLKPSKVRSKTTLKGYLALFVCLTTKAVHLELVSSLTTDDFLQTLRRFIARRGLPQVIFSDNGTNFQGASNKLKDLYSFFKSQDSQLPIHDYLTSNQITWKFIPARSPHWGGIWEAGVRISKHHLVRIIGDSILTYEQFSTVLAEVEAVMNSRPLCKLNGDPSDLTALTPGHFLIGTPLTAIPDRDISSIPENRLSSWTKCVQIKQHFWKRYMTEYLHSLQTKSKWTKKERNLTVGDLVLIIDNTSSPLHWPIAKVIQVFPGSDNLVRAALVQTKLGQFTRPIAKLCPLPSHDET